MRAALPPLSEDLAWPDHLRPFTPRDTEIHKNPYAHYAWMRENAPVLRTHAGGVDLWFISRYEDVQAGLLDVRRFSSQVIDPKELPFLLVIDPPEHTRLRMALARAFTPKAVAKLDGFIAERVALHWGKLVKAGRGEVFEGLAALLALETIGHIIGIPVEQAYHIRQWTQDAQDYFGRIARRAAGSASDAAGMANMLATFATCLREASKGTEETVAGNIGRLSADGTLSEHETTHLCVMLLLAGSETTAISVLNGLMILAEAPLLFKRLAAEPAEIPKFVQELIRLKSPAHRLGRIATEDVAVAGCTIPAGSEIRFLPASANRDSNKFANPDMFDMDRNAAGAIGFGYGPHNCIGMHLAKQELKIAFQTIVTTVGSVALDSDHEILYNSGGSMGVVGPISLGVVIN